MEAQAQGRRQDEGRGLWERKGDFREEEGQKQQREAEEVEGRGLAAPSWILP